MAKRVAGVTEKLMEAAKQEFLKNGYERASLQTIAEKAGSSKGAIYIRYPDKESLYRSLVQPAIDGFCELLQSVLYQFNRLSGEEQTTNSLKAWTTCTTILMSSNCCLPAGRTTHIRSSSTGLSNWTPDVLLNILKRQEMMRFRAAALPQS